MSSLAIEAMSKKRSGRRMESEGGDEREGLGGACVVSKGARRSPLEAALPDDLLCAILRHVINHKQGFRKLGKIQTVNKLFRHLMLEDDQVGRMTGGWLWCDKQFVSMKWGDYVLAEMVPIPLLHPSISGRGKVLQASCH